MSLSTLRLSSVIFTTLLGCSAVQAQVFTQQGSKLVGTGYIGGNPVQEGYSVAISADGSTALVGGYKDNGNTGAAWVFTRDNVGNWTQQGNKLVSGDTGAAFGSSVALSSNGNIAIIGGFLDNGNIGAAWIFT